MAAKGAETTAEVGPPVSGAREQTANTEFATSVGSFDGQPRIAVSSKRWHLL